MNPKLENLQFLGIFGILEETMKLIYQWRKIFTQITLSFILPFSLLSFVNMVISIFFLTKTKPSNNPISSQIIYHLIFNIFTVIFSLLSTATVIYTVACIYAGRDVSFKHVITVLPKVGRRVLITFLCVFVALFAFNFVAMLVIFFILMIVFLINGPNGFSFDNYSLIIIVSIFMMIILVVGAWYLTLSWGLSSVVSVLEELCGFKAMAKSKALVKGKMRMITKLFMLLGLPWQVIQFVFYHLAIQSPSAGVVVKCILGILWVLLFSLYVLVALVATTLLYFVCKSYHHESVDELALSDHLQTYLSTDYYVPLKVDDDVLIEKLQIV